MSKVFRALCLPSLMLLSSSLLAQSPCDFTFAVEKAMPAMVKVNAKEIDHFTIYDEKNRPHYKEGYGSGVLISPDGLIVTNYHVIKGASKITVTSSFTQKTHAVVKKWIDPESDLALLQIEATDLPYLSFGDSDHVRVGEWIGIVGNPLSQENVLTIGIVSGKEIRDIGLHRHEDYIRTNAHVHPGNSGGPVFSLDGELIGIHVGHTYVGYADLKSSAGIGFEIPSNQVKRVTDLLLREGSAKRPYFGASLQFIDESLAKDLGLQVPEALIVLAVEEDSPAWNAGLRRKDVILKYGNDLPLEDLHRELNLHIDPNSTLPLTIFRRGEQIDLSVQLGAQIRQEGQSPGALQKLGLYVDDVQAERVEEIGYDFGTKGVLVTKVKRDSPADKAGLEPSFLITGIVFDLYNERPVRSVQELVQIMDANDATKPFFLEVRRPDQASSEYLLLNEPVID